MKKFQATLIVLFALLAIGAATEIRLATQVIDQVTAGQVFGRDWNAGTGTPGWFTPTPLTIGAFGDLSGARISILWATGTTITEYGDVFTAVGTGSNAAASSTLPAYNQQATSTVSGNVASLVGNLNYVVGRSIQHSMYTAQSGVTLQRMWRVLADQTAATMGASDDPAGNYVGLTFCNDGAAANCAVDDTNWQFVTKDNVTQNQVDTGVAADTSFHNWLIYETPGVNFKLYECVTLPCPPNAWTLRATSSSNLPTSGTPLRYAITTTCTTCTPTAQNHKTARQQIVTTF